MKKRLIFLFAGFVFSTIASAATINLSFSPNMIANKDLILYKVNIYDVEKVSNTIGGCGAQQLAATYPAETFEQSLNNINLAIKDCAIGKDFQNRTSVITLGFRNDKKANTYPNSCQNIVLGSATTIQMTEAGCAVIKTN